ncbi:hypothetical protein PsYK624_025900 [Phanerochaete sordida]|uniref:F-box domain-containing protein n=1 Tax=Phanerochaete sordida TaxID=48140 RepID=A0A9P3G245_9APHY|nr:hypothetical protein PsYK624_025900 [Phanerochaete sordida]
MDLKAQRRRVEELDAQGTLLERRIEDLIEELESVRLAYSENRLERAASIPLHTLPDDVLKLMLEAAYDHEDNGDCFELQSIVITHVSRRLRQLALSLPRLWNCLHLDTPTPLLELQLSRSGDLPLRVLLYHNKPERRDGQSAILRDNNMITRYVEQLGLLLRLHAHRIAHLTIDSHSARLFLSILPRLHRQPFPQAMLLELTAERHALTVKDPYLLPECPKLDMLWLSAIPASFSNVFYESLTYLSITDTKVLHRDLSDVARACPNLAELHMSSFRVVTNTSETIRFPHLETLGLGGWSRPDIYLDWLDMPSLSDLTIFSADLIPHRFDTRGLESLRPFPTARTVEFSRMQVSAVPLYDENILKYVPNVTTLLLRRCPAKDGSLFEHLATADPPSLAALQTLIATELEKDAQDVLLRIVQHRARHELPLKEVQLGRGILDNMDEELLRALGEHVAVTKFEE